MRPEMRLRIGILAAMVLLGFAVLGVWWFAPSVLVEAQRLLDRDTLEALVARVGIWGPFLIIGLMIIAVVASPIPSAPIALAAGAAYGHLWGTVQVVLGAEIGALIAFGLARTVGRDAVQQLFGDKVDARWVCEQAHQQLKEELGLDHFEGRSWTGLHRHAYRVRVNPLRHSTRATLELPFHRRPTLHG